MHTILLKGITMARPRIFVSSTYYDLKHLRSSLENFIESLGFEAILSEKGDIAFLPERPLDESCYREAGTADIFVLIIGGRYGSEKSGEKAEMPKDFFDRYESITKKEYESAVESNVPTYILIEKAVYSDFETFLENKDNTSIIYAHVDSVNIFHFINFIFSQPRNNPVYQFDRYKDIEIWLREQWAGLFRELIHQRSAQAQISSLASQVAQLAEISKTLKSYLEEVVSKVSPEDSAEIIAKESKRLEEAQRQEEFERNPFVKVMCNQGIPVERLREIFTKSDSYEELFDQFDLSTKIEAGDFEKYADMFNAVDKAREILGVAPLKRIKITKRKAPKK
jgi:hypothetical protein